MLFVGICEVGLNIGAKRILDLIFKKATKKEDTERICIFLLNEMCYAHEMMINHHEMHQRCMKWNKSLVTTWPKVISSLQSKHFKHEVHFMNPARDLFHCVLTGVKTLSSRWIGDTYERYTHIPWAPSLGWVYLAQQSPIQRLRFQQPPK